MASLADVNVLTNIFLLLFSPLNALYEDQAGKYDWRQQYVGQAKAIFWDESHQSGRKILVATERNTLASIHGYNGSIAWRKIIEDGNKGKVNSLLHQGSYMVSVSGGGQFIRSWSANTGNLIWETVTSSEETAGSADAVIWGSGDNLVVLSSYGLLNLNMQNGQQLWSLDLPSSEEIDYSYLSYTAQVIYAIGITAASHVTVVTVDQQGMLASQRSVPAAWITKDTSCEVTGLSYFLCLEASSDTLRVLDIQDGQMFTPTSLQDLSLMSGQNPHLEQVRHGRPSDIPEILLRLSTEHVSLLRLSGTTVLVVKDMPAVSAVEIVKLGDKEVMVTAERTSPEFVKFTGYDFNTNTELTDLSSQVVLPSFHGNPLQLRPLLFQKKDTKIGYKILVINEDSSIQLVQKPTSQSAKKGSRGGVVHWTREEGLAYVMAVEMVDLPVSENEAKFEDEFGSQQDDILAMFVKRFSTQVSQIKTFIQKVILHLQGHRQRHALDEIDEEAENMDDEDLTRDDFNLHKVIVVVSAIGKIYGLRSTNGKIVWQHFMPNFAPFDGFGRQSVLLYMQRSTAHFPHAPQCMVLGQSRINGNAMVYAFNPVTGHAVAKMPPTGKVLNYKILQASLLNEMNDQFLKGVIFLDTDFKVHTYPKAFESIVSDSHDNLFMFLVNTDTGSVIGYRIAKDEQEALFAQQVWNINLQINQQKITNVVSKRISEHVHSQGRVLGDRSVLYKYLNPNLVAITTEGDEPVSATSTQKGPNNFINVYLVDSITGHIVFSTNHKRVRGPVQIIHCENWLVYNYYNQKTRRHEITVLELYEGKEQSNSTAFSSFAPPPQPLVMRQSYVFSMPVFSMAPTVTEKGITSRHIMVAFKMGGLMSLPKAFLDPRRPIMPTQEHMEEGTIPYMPEIPVNMEAIVNYNRSIFGIRGIHTAPAGLESTSLVLAYGTDLFFTRVMPSKMFDVLKEDFDYIFIACVLVGMIVLSVVSKKLASRRALNKAWK